METMQQNEGSKNDSVPENSQSQSTDTDQSPGNGGDEAGASEDLSAALAAAEAEAASYKDRFLRAAADMENMRRRMEKDRTDLLQYGLEKIMNDLLPVLDAFDKAHAEAAAGQSEDKDPLFEGLELLQKQLRSTLEKHGLAEVDPAGEPFDPNFHQAIQKIDRSDVESESVQDVFQKGYTLNNRLVRPAMVSVAVPSREKEENN